MAPTRAPADLTIEELAAVLGQALGTDYEGIRNGRVRDLPDARTIRWYQTLGIVDRPTAFRGRTALYARRHVLQLAAIKKLQAADFPLADIQRGLAGKTDAELARAAGLRLDDVDRVVRQAILARSQAETARFDAALRAAPAASRRKTAFWKARPAAAGGPATSDIRAAATAALLPIQSLPLGAAALVWNGRPLTTAESATVARLAQPLIDFLSTRAAATDAERSGRAAAVPPRPTKGDRP